MPADLARSCGIVAGVGVAAMGALLVVARLRQRFEDLLCRWDPYALRFAVIDAALTLFGSVWLLAVVQRPPVS